MKKRIFIILFGIAVPICLLLVFGGWKLQQNFSQYARTSQATQLAKEALNRDHADEVRTAIVNFETIDRVGGFTGKAAQLPQVMTGKELEDRLRLETPFPTDPADKSPSWVAKRVWVEGLEVLEYSPQRFKTIACVKSDDYSIDNKGVVLGKSTDQNIELYVFWKKEGAWKVAARFPIWYWEAAIRDWRDVPDWEKEIIGGLPVGEYPSCDNRTPTP